MVGSVTTAAMRQTEGMEMDKHVKLLALLGQAALEATTALHAKAGELPEIMTPEQMVRMAGISLADAHRVYRDARLGLQMELDAEMENIIARELEEALEEAEAERVSYPKRLPAALAAHEAEMDALIAKIRERRPDLSGFLDMAQRKSAEFRASLKQAAFRAHVEWLRTIFAARLVSEDTATQIAELLAVRE